MNTDRAFRTAPSRNFNGGYTGQSKLAPEPGLFSRILRIRKDRRHVR